MPGQSAPRPRDSILTGRSLESAAAREVNNERNHRLLYTPLLEKVGALNKSDRGEDYQAENEIFEKASTSLMYAATGGVVVGLAAFLSIRYIPTLLVNMIGGETKAHALKQKEAATGGLQKGGMFLIEASFGFWAGWRGYHTAADQIGAGGAYEEISKIPLVRGRSSISDGICKDWVDLTYSTVPPEFWHNMSHGEEDCKLKDYQAWKAIRSFADNCVKRSAYEDALRRERGLDGGIPVAIPDPGVPERYRPVPLTKADAEVLLEDAPR